VVSYFLFNEFPGVWKNWTLAVLAINLKDARDYIKIHHGSGRYLGEIKFGTVKADCGAVTDAAQAEIHTENERMNG
jgi:hypothetical protein